MEKPAYQRRKALHRAKHVAGRPSGLCLAFLARIRFHGGWLLLAALCLLPLLCSHLAAQQLASPSPDGILTLNVQSRLVVEDVLVTDGKGKPVHGLPQTAFHILDQDRPQTIRGFEEGLPENETKAGPPLPPLDPGTFTNDPAREGHGASEVLLIDADGMAVIDQMFLLQELKKAILALPAGLPTALFRVSNGLPVEIRGFTTDKADLRRAAEECLPFLTHAIDSPFQSAVEQLMTVTGFLQQRPGRKNLLWFAGAFPLVPVAEGEMRSVDRAGPDFATRQHVIHQVQEALAEARISVYPVDVRGVITTSSFGTPSGTGAGAGRDPQATSGFGRTPVVLGTSGGGVQEERDQMHQLANATGGKAYMLNNLAAEIDEAFDLGQRAYSLSYTPTNYTTDESWHRILIRVDGNYHLSYRPGYLAIWTGVAGGRQGTRLENGRKVATTLDPDHLAERPIVFRVSIIPAAQPDGTVARKGPLRLTLRFQIPGDQLKFARKDDRWRNELLLYTYAYDASGRVKSAKLHEADTALTDEQMARAMKQQLPMEQVLTIPKDAAYLMTAVRDKQSKRIGTLMLSTSALRALPAGKDVTSTAASAPAPSASGRQQTPSPAP